VKPSHYDDDGYIIQRLRSSIPSNSLASLFGLARDCAERRVLGDVPIEIHAFDKTNTHPSAPPRPDDRGGRQRNGDAGRVQSNQMPRALDIARPLRAWGIQVGIGGFHVSGTLSMLNGVDAHLQRATAMGISLFAGRIAREGDVLGPPLSAAAAYRSLDQA